VFGDYTKRERERWGKVDRCDRLVEHLEQKVIRVDYILGDSSLI